MATLKQPAPMSFSGNVPEQWKKWKQQLELYLVATVPKATREQKGAVLLSCIGQDGLDIYNNFTFAEREDKLEYELLLTKFETHCAPLKNSVFARHQFWSTQRGNLTLDQFVTDLKRKAEACEFQAAEKPQLIRDKLGISTSSQPRLQQLLLQTVDLNLDRCIELIRLEECSEKQAAEMAASSRGPVQVSTTSVAAVSRTCGRCGSRTVRGVRD